MDSKELQELKLKLSHINAAVIRLQTKHHNLSHRVDGIDDELKDLWDTVVRKEEVNNVK